MMKIQKRKIKTVTKVSRRDYGLVIQNNSTKVILIKYTPLSELIQSLKGQFFHGFRYGLLRKSRNIDTTAIACVGFWISFVGVVILSDLVMKGGL